MLVYGAGVPLLLTDMDGSAARWVGPMMAGGVAGRLGTLPFAADAELLVDEIPLVLGLSAWTIYQTVGWSSWTRHASSKPDRSSGVGLMVSGVGSALAIGVPAYTQLDLEQSLAVQSLGIWGSWLGGWGGLVANLDRESQGLPVELALGDVFLTGAFLTVAGGWQPSWRTVGGFNAMGAGGAVVGSVVGIAASAQPPGVLASGWPHVGPRPWAGLVGRLPTTGSASRKSYVFISTPIFCIKSLSDFDFLPFLTLI